MLKEVTLKQAEIDVGEFKFTITQIPTATSESWYTIQYRSKNETNYR